MLAWITDRLLPTPPPVPSRADLNIEPPDSPLMQRVEEARRNGGVFKAWYSRKPPSEEE